MTTLRSLFVDTLVVVVLTACAAGAAAQSLFVGELITDDAIRLGIYVHEPGEYFCHSDLHPALTATLVLES